MTWSSACVAQVMDAAWRSAARGEGRSERVMPMDQGWRRVSSSRLAADGPEEAGRSHGWSTPGMIKGRHVEVMKMSSAKSRGARREVGHESSSGLAVWASKLSRRPVSWFGPQNQDPGSLARLSGPGTCRGTWRRGLGGLGLKTTKSEGFPVLASKLGGGAWRCLGRREGCVDGSQRLRGVEARCAKFSRPSDEERKRNRQNAPAWVV